jgi:hypothetical protein
LIINNHINNNCPIFQIQTLDLCIVEPKPNAGGKVVAEPGWGGMRRVDREGGGFRDI